MELRSRTRRPRSAHPAWISRVRERARDNRGVAVVEAAFVTPVFFMLIMGLVEIGMALNDNLALASTVRAGSRVASAAGNDSSADVYTLLRMATESAAIDRTNIVLVVVYKPATFGEAPTTTCTGGTPVTGVCNVYTPADMVDARIQVTEETAALAEGRATDPSKIKFGCKVTSPDRFWCPSARKVTQAGTGPDYVGVWMKIRHPWVTKMFGSDVMLTDRSVIRLEPRAS